MSYTQNIDAGMGDGYHNCCGEYTCICETEDSQMTTTTITKNATVARLYDFGTDATYAVLINHMDHETGIAFVRFIGDDGKTLFGKLERIVPITDLRKF